MKNLDFVLRSQSFVSSSYAYLNALWVQCRNASFADANYQAERYLENFDAELNQLKEAANAIANERVRYEIREFFTGFRRTIFPELPTADSVFQNAWNLRRLDTAAKKERLQNMQDDDQRTFAQIAKRILES